MFELGTLPNYFGAHTMRLQSVNVKAQLLFLKCVSLLITVSCVISFLLL